MTRLYALFTMASPATTTAKKTSGWRMEFSEGDFSESWLFCVKMPTTGADKEDFDNIDLQLVWRRGDGKLPQQDFTRVQRLHLQSCHQVIHFRICQLCDWWMPKLIELLMKGHKPGIPFSIEWWWAARDSKGGRDYQLGSQVSLSRKSKRSSFDIWVYLSYAEG